MSTEGPETYAEAAARTRRQRAESAGHAMMGKPLDIQAGTVLGHDIGQQQPYVAPHLTEEQRVKIERGAKPSLVSRLFGIALGLVVAGGTLTLVVILFIKAIVWAWSL
jgi:hypothetical protein